MCALSIALGNGATSGQGEADSPNPIERMPEAAEVSFAVVLNADVDAQAAANVNKVTIAAL